MKSDSTKHRVPGGTLARAATGTLLYGGIYAGIMAAVESVLPGHGEHAATGIAATVAPIAAAVLPKAEHLLGHLLGHKLVSDVFPHDPTHHTRSGLNHDIEQALARAACKSIVALMGEWESQIPAEKRSFGAEQWDLTVLRPQCERFLHAETGGDIPAEVAEWLSALGEREILQHTGMEATDSVDLPALPCSFTAYFDWRFPAEFQLHFTEELVSRDAVRDKFALLIQRRSLALLAENAAGIAAIRDQLTALAERIQPGDARWVADFTAQLRPVVEELHVIARKQLADLTAVVQADGEKTRAVVIEETGKIREELRRTRRPHDPPFGLPPAASKLFGRGALVEDLVQRLRRQQRTEVWGLAGFGKTALAAEALFHIVGTDRAGLAGSPFPDGVVFLDLYKSKGDFDTAWNTLADAFDPSLPTEIAPSARAQKACAGRTALIILEGAEELRDELPRFIGVLSPENRFLILTRDESQTAAGRRIELSEMLGDTDALQLLRHLAGERPPQAILDAVQARLAGHPLALTWAASQLRDHKQPPDNFLRDLEAEPFTKLSEPGADRKRTLQWMFDRSVRLMEECTRNVLAAAARVAQPFDADFARAAGGAEADLARLVEFAFLRLDEAQSAWQFAHALAAQFARRLPLPGERLAPLGRWAVAALAAADSRIATHGLAPLDLALAHATALLGNDDATRTLRNVASALLYHGPDGTETFGIRRGRLDFARRAIVAVRRWHDQAGNDEKATPAWQRESSVSLNRLGDLAVAQGDLAGALRYFTEDKAIAERLAASDPANAAWQRDLSVSLEKLGDLAVAQGDLAGALRCFTEAKTIAERLAASDPANAEWQRDLAVSFEKLGDVAVKQNDLDAGLRYYSESKTITARLAASDPDNAAWQRTVAVSHFKLFQFAQKSGDEAMMEAELRACFTVLDGMKRRGMHLDEQSARFHGQLAGRFGAA